MSMFWNRNPELYDEIIVNEMIGRGVVTQEEADNVDAWELVHLHENRPDFYHIVEAAEADFWASKVDEAMDRHREKAEAAYTLKVLT